MNSFLIWPSRLCEPCITDQNLLRHRNSTSHTTRLLQNMETRGEERKQCLSRPRLRAVRDTTVRYCTLVCTLYREQEQDCYWTSLYRAYQSWVSVGASTGQTRMQLTSVPDQLARSTCKNKIGTACKNRSDQNVTYLSARSTCKINLQEPVW